MMNERIREFAEQAEDKEVGYYFFDREKFAKLIIKECMNICVNTRIGNREYNQVRMDCQYDIAKHFGVES